MMYFSTTFAVLVIGLLSCIFAQENLPSKDELLEKMPGLGNIPGIENFNASSLPTVEAAQNLFKQKCEKNGGPTAFQTADNARQTMMTCLASLVNVTTLKDEMEEAKPTGDLDIVFKKYCGKSPILKKCVTDFTDAVEPCLDEQERENKKVIQNVTDSLLNFVCFKEGDRIALFIAAGGPECLQSKQEAVQNCANNTFGSYIPTPNPNTGSLPGLESIPALIFGSKECNDIVKLQTCAVKELETCEDPTSANIVDSLFNFILKETPCKALISNQPTPNAERSNRVAASSDSIPSSVATLLTTIFMAISVRFV